MGFDQLISLRQRQNHVPADQEEATEDVVLASFRWHTPLHVCMCEEWTARGNEGDLMDGEELELTEELCQRILGLNAAGFGGEFAPDPRVAAAMELTIRHLRQGETVIYSAA